MFCPKCGAQALNGAEFCQKCGARLVSDSKPQPVPASSPNAGVPAQPHPQQQAGIPVTPMQVSPQQYAAPSFPPKKKSKKKFIIFGVIALAAVVIALIIANLSSDPDYISSIQQKMPYESNEGLSITYGEVFAQYIQDEKWTLDKSEHGADAKISGTVSGTELPILVEISVKLDPKNHDRGSITLSSLSIGETSYTGVDAEAVLYAIFKCYEGGDKDLAGMENVLLGTIPVETELTEPYTDEDAGCSFQYPGDWTATEPGTYADRVELIHNENCTEHRASIIMVFDTVDVLDVFSGDTGTVKTHFEEGESTFLSLGDAEVDGLPAKKLTYKSKDFLSGKDNIVTTYYYKRGEAVNWLEFSCAEDTLDSYKPVFDAIVDSYTVLTPAPVPDTAEGICLYGVPVEEYFSASLADVREALDIPVGDDRNNTVRLYMSDGEVTSIEIMDADILTMDGESLKKNRAGLAALLGEPDGENTEDGAYSVSYYLPDCTIFFELGSAANQAWRVTVGPPREETDDTVYYIEQDTTFYLEDDPMSWITLYADGTFDMQVNVYEGYLNVYGTYIGTGVGFTCNVTENNLGRFIGNDVESFDLVVAVDGNQNEVLQYRGAQIGTTRDNAIYR